MQQFSDIPFAKDVARQLQDAIHHFRRDQPVTVVNEGLFQYLDAAEMETMAS
jgi:O-methyltransferase involved in polyketide biosynthesis